MMNDLPTVTGMIVIVGIGIQQFLELIDPFVILISKGLFNYLKKTPCFKKLKNNEVKEINIKKTLTIIVTTALGYFFVKASGLSILHLLDESLKGKYLDSILTAMVVSGDTEVVNSVQKFFSIVKEKNKQEMSSTANSV